MKKRFRQNSTTFVFAGLVFALFCSFPLLADVFKCEDTFSRLYYESQTLTDLRTSRNLQPDFLNIQREVNLVHLWNKPPSAPTLLTALFPKDVHFINHQLFKPEAPTVIKSAEIGDAIMARAHWEHKINNSIYPFASNVSFSLRALIDNLQVHERNWLVSEKAKAAIFYFHGGGTMTTGVHTANAMISHFKTYGIDVVAVDLPWHAEGHRYFLNNLELEIEVLGSFARKFIPPNVPLFVAGHSWGGVFAEKIMRMSDRPKEVFSFHPKLSGAMILSTALTDLQGIRNYFDKGKTAQTAMSWAEKQEEYGRISEEVLTKRVDEFPPDERDILTDMVAEGKISPVGGFYAKIMFQMSQEMPAHKGDEYIPALMQVGKYDALTHLGFEREYEIYKDYTNIHSVYLDELYTLFDKSLSYPVGHMLGNRVHPDLPAFNSAPVHWVEMRKFISKVLNLPEMSIERQNEMINMAQMVPQNKGERIKFKNRLRIEQEKQKEALGVSSHTPDIVHIIQHYAMDMAFRKWLQDYLHIESKRTKDFIDLKTETQAELETQIKDHIIDHIMLHSKKVLQLLNTLTELEVVSDKNFDLESMQSEIDVLVNPNSTNWIQANTNVMQALTQLGEKIKQALETRSVSDLKEVSETARAIKKTHENWLVSFSTRARHKLQGSIRRILASENHESAQEQLQSMKLSTETQKIISELLDTYFENKAILANTYIPSMDVIKEHGIKKGKESKIKNILNSLSNTIWNRSKYEHERTGMWKEHNKLLAEYHKLLDEIKQYISHVEHFLKRANIDPPNSLKEDYRQNEMEFEKLMSAYFDTEKTTDQISTFVFEKQSPVQYTEVLSHAKGKEDGVKQFIALYKQYVQNRRVLRKKTISAMETGEMGQEAQTAVIALYGHGSNGEYPRMGSNSLYLKLEDIIKQLGQFESAKRSLNEVMITEQEVYNESMNALLTNMESSHSGIRKASNMFDTSSKQIVDVILSGKINHIDPEKIQTDPSERQRALDVLNRNVAVFKDVLKHWRDLKSSLPPPLPTEK